MLTRQFTYTLPVDKLRHTDHTRRLSHRPLVTRLFHRTVIWQTTGCGRCELERCKAVNVGLRHASWFRLAQLTRQTQQRLQTVTDAIMSSTSTYTRQTTVSLTPSLSSLFFTFITSRRINSFLSKHFRQHSWRNDESRYLRIIYLCVNILC